MNSNRCRAANCNEVLPNKILFCRRHWRLVPTEAKHHIYTFGRYGTEEAYHQAVHDAAEAVRTEEQKRWRIGLGDAV